MKHVLILCDLFPPAFGPRMGYLCKYLKQSDWTPIVVTEKIPACNFQFLENICEVHTINYYTARHPFLRKLQWLVIFLLSFGFDYKNWKIRRYAEKLISQKQFDALLCSTYRTFPLPAAHKLANKYKLPLIVDLRDIIEQYSGNEFIARKIPAIPGLQQLITFLFREHSLKIRNQILPQAACITTVSDWHVKTLRQYNPNVQLIYNGFDPEIFYPKTYPTDRFIITYTGRLLSKAMRDPSLLFESLRQLATESILTPQNCRVYWYVDPESWNVISAEAEKYGITSFIEMKGYVEASQIPEILNKSSVLLLLTNKSSTTGPKGVMTTKLFEALAVNKPILCVRNDEGVLEKALKESNAGLAASNVDEVSTFLKHYFTLWKEFGYTKAETDLNVLKKYSRKEQAKQFEYLFDSLIKKRYDFNTDSHS